MNELALFSGAGGGILGGHLLGWRTVCAVEWEPYAACVLAARQNDGVLPPFPIWDDVQTFDGRPWRGIVDVISGGFPCQDISAAGKGAGIDGERSGMWREMARIIHEVRPRFVFVENSPMLTSRGLGTVLGDLASMGFDAKWGVLGAADVNAPHQRDRIWIKAILADTESIGDRRELRGLYRKNETQWESKKHWEDKTTKLNNGCKDVTNPKRTGLERREDSGEQEVSRARCSSSLVNPSSRRYELQERQVRTGRDSSQHTSWWEVEPDLGRVADGVAARVDRLKAIGNGQVPEVARTAWSVI